MLPWVSGLLGATYTYVCPAGVRPLGQKYGVIANVALEATCTSYRRAAAVSAASTSVPAVHDSSGVVLLTEAPVPGASPVGVVGALAVLLMNSVCAAP